MIGESTGGEEFEPRFVRIKGIACMASVEFLAEKRPEVSYLELLGSLPAVARRAFEVPSPLAARWYRFEDFLELQKAVLDRIPGDRQPLLEELGRFSCDFAVSRIYKPFLLGAAVEAIMQRSGRLMTMHFDNLEGLRFEVDPGRFRLVMEHIPRGHPDHCMRMTGFIRRFLALAGAAEPNVAETECGYDGEGSLCVWSARWKGTTN